MISYVRRTTSLKFGWVECPPTRESQDRVNIDGRKYHVEKDYLLFKVSPSLRIKQEKNRSRKYCHGPWLSTSFLKIRLLVYWGKFKKRWRLYWRSEEKFVKVWKQVDRPTLILKLLLLWKIYELVWVPDKIVDT